MKSTHIVPSRTKDYKGHYVKPVPPLNEKQICRFKRKIRRTRKCWLWTGFREPKCGYGIVALKRKIHRAHRVSFVLFKGLIPSNRPFILHKCDNPGCVNPRHLWAGTIDDNNRDMCRKRRNATGNRHGWYTKPESRLRGLKNGAYTKPWMRPKGIRHGMHKLIENEVRKILALHAAGSTMVALAARFRVTKGCIGFIVRRQTWKHIA